MRKGTGVFLIVFMSFLLSGVPLPALDTLELDGGLFSITSKDPNSAPSPLLPAIGMTFPIQLPLNMGGTGHFLVPNQPKISPDGKWISYVSSKGGAPEIWLWSFKNGHEVQLTNLGGRINALSWSPDNQWIVFSCDRYGNFDIWIHN